jgi:LmbE family N-acetylglucosaminyl deacetylase
MKTVLVVAAHPDDEVLGCGGTVARLVKEGCKVFTLILGEGITSRSAESLKSHSVQKKLDSLKESAIRANMLLGVKKVFFLDMPDNQMDTVSLISIVKGIENIKDAVKPDCVFTHYLKDLNIDHRITTQAVLTASRPLQKETVKEIYSFEVLSSTEFNYPLSFCPDAYFDISNTMNLKLAALKRYNSEMRSFPHPRSLKFVELNAVYHGVRSGLRKAEAFKIIRVVR